MPGRQLLPAFAALGVLLAFAGQPAAGQLGLAWIGIEDAIEYAVERQTVSQTFAEIGRTIAPVVEYVDARVLGLTTYCYRVRAATAGGYTDYSNVACAAVPAGPGTFSDDFARPASNGLG